MTIGENGILNQSQEVSKKSKKEETKEKVSFEVNGSYDKTGKINIEDLNKNLKENLENVELKGEDKTYKVLSESNKIKKLPVTVKYNGYEIEITEKEINLIEINNSEYLVDRVEIGDYVDIGINYKNVQNFNPEFTKTDTALTGWRVMSKSGSGDTGIVKLVSAGCPLTYCHQQGDVEASIKKLENLYTEIQLDGNPETVPEDVFKPGFVKSGFGDDEKDSGSEDLKTIFDECEYIKKEENNGDSNWKEIHALGCGTTYNGNSGSKATAYKELDEIEKLYKEITNKNKTMTDFWDVINDDPLNWQEKFDFRNDILRNESENWKESYLDLLCNGQYFYLGGSSFDGELLWTVADICGVFRRNNKRTAEFVQY